ncbi:phage tail spike protein [Streptococcus iniae]|uniref:phage tail spike protein n=1 Tax=Streptococcus iniae TaxID=1346 RepID=UPI00217D4617|nr:phage tail spike protein [Streptococcus iniae]
MLYLLDGNTKTAKWNGVPLHEASSALIKEELNGDFVLTLRYPITDSGIYRTIKEDMLIKSPTPVLGSQLFRVKKPVESDDFIDVTCYHISDDVMQHSIKAMNAVQVGCASALSQMVQQAKTSMSDFSFSSDIAQPHTFQTTETKTLYSVLLDGAHSIIGTWEGELVRDNFSLIVKSSRGSNKGVVITTHHNLKSYKRSKTSTTVVTRIHATSTFKPAGSDKEVSLSVRVDSPLINQYAYINERELVNNDCRTVEELRKWAESKFKSEGIDKVHDAILIESYELDGQIVHIGDTVNLKSRKHQVDILKKAVAYEYNALTEEYVSITFDDKASVGSSSPSSGLSTIAKSILGAASTAQEIAVQRAVENANKAFDAEFEKQKLIIEDGIEKAKAESEQYADRIRQTIDGQLAQTTQQIQTNKDLQVRQYQELLSKSNSNASLAQEAKNLGNQVKLLAESVKTEAQKLFSDAQANTQTVKLELDTAKTDLLAKLQGFEGTKTIVSNLETATGGTLKTIQQLKNDATSMGSRLSSTETGLEGVKTSLESLWVGDRNLLADTENLSDQSPEPNLKYMDKAVKKIVRVANATSYTEGYNKQISVTLLNPKEMILSFYAKSETAGTVITCYCYSPNVSKDAITSEGEKSTTTDGAIRFTLTNTWKRYWVRYTFKGNLSGKQSIIIGRLANASSVEQVAYICAPALYYGHHNKEWSPSDLDTSQQFANYEQTLNRHVAEIGERFNTVNGLISSNTTKINQNASAISLKASSSELNQLKQVALTSESSEIKLLKDKVSTIVTRSDIDSMITGKGYSTTTAVNQTASSLEKKISSVSTDVTKFQTVKETVDSYSRVIGTNGETLSEIKLMTDNYKRSIANDGAISQVIQTASNLVSRVGNLEEKLPNLVYDPTNYSKYKEREPNSNLIMTGTSDYKLLRITQAGLAVNSWKGFQVPLHSSRFIRGDKLSYRVNLWVDVLPDEQIGFEIKKGATKIASFFIKPTRTGGAQIFTGTVTVNETTTTTDDYALHVWLQKNGTVAIGQLSIVYGDVIPTSFYDSTSSQQVATETLVQQTAGSWSVQNLNSAGALISGINLGANGINRIDGRLTHITGNTLIDNAVIKSAMVDKLKTANFESGSVSTTVLAANAVTAEKMVIDQAFFTKLMANEAYLKQLFAKSAFITQVQAITLSADKISGGILKAINNATSFNLSTGDLTFNTSSTIIFNQSNNALKRTRNGSTAFLHFNDSSGGGVFAGLGVTSHNEGIKSQDTGRFAGVRVFRDNDSSDQVEIYGDNILLGHAFSTSAYGVWVKPTKLKGGVDLIDFLRWCRTEILRLHNVKTTETAYNYTIWGDF